MQLKRKRSSSSSSSSFSSLSGASSPEISSPQRAFDFHPQLETPAAAFLSRTTKRLRNGRPADALVHARTLAMLYAGARTKGEGQGQGQEEDEGQEQRQQEEERQRIQASGSGPTDGARWQQRSLHSFWGGSTTARQMAG